ncbi:hypothetical protein E5D57_011841 [Metarhizium anisopliae]|nr:hypothetical protein E5D57_011841 [Metarhizium anisopliae]
MARLCGRKQDCPARSGRCDQGGQQVPNGGVSAIVVDALEIRDSVGSKRNDFVAEIQHALTSFRCGP